jgi:molybdopterin molybdotransferase
MAQLSDDCFAFGGQLMPLDQALATIAERAVPLPARRTVALRAARGAILAAGIAAPRDVPPHDNSAVDGYAVFHDDLRSDGETVLPVAGRAAAGHPFPRALPRGEALRIFTGAPMPEGPDTVFMQEDCVAEGGSVRLPAGLKKGANRRRAGEDVKAGDIVLRAGQRVRPQEVGLAASLGLVELPVYAPLKVAVLSTGDEVRDPGAALPPGGIYDANRYALMSLVEALGCEVTDLGIVEDRLPALRDALEKAAAGHDLVVTSGGMSTGEEDHMKAAVEALGRLYFWRLAIKPGRPVALGQLGRVPLIGLPGNPVAVMVTFLLLARPLILRLAGASVAEPRSFPARAEFDYRKKAGRREFVRASLGAPVDGLPAARRFPRDGAGILSSMTQSDGLVVLEEHITRVAPGDPVPFLPFAELLS